MIAPAIQQLAFDEEAEIARFRRRAIILRRIARIEAAGAPFALTALLTITAVAVIIPALANVFQGVQP